jgi:predicted metal-dependent peptidase
MECHDSTAMDVFYLLPEDINKNENVDNHDNWESFFDNVGNIHKDFIDAFKEIVDSNIENSALTDQEKDKLDEIKNTFKENSDAYVAQVGNTIGQKNRPIDGFSKESLNWNKILNNVTQDKKQQDVWTKPNRRLISTYPELLLPSVESTEREDLFIAIDSSGSIDPEKLKLFLSILKNTPKRFNIHSITFDRKCYFYDIKSNNDPQGGGGTTFSIIENYIQENFKKYPKCVVVFTDGFGNVVTPQYPNRWLWILYGSDTSTRYCDTMKHYQLQDLLK